MPQKSWPCASAALSPGAAKRVNMRDCPLYEVNTHSTNPLLADTDGDGFDDGEEVANTAIGRNPNLDQSALFGLGTNRLRNSTAQQQAHGLYAEGAIRTVYVGAPLIGVSAGEIHLELQLQKPDDLETWTDFGTPAERTDPAVGNKAFYRLFMK